MDQVNRSGGVIGRKIRMVSEDDGSEPEKAQIAASNLIAKKRVVAVIGEVASSRTRAAAPVCQQNRIPMISPAATDPRITQIGNYIFRACFIDSFQGNILARFVANSLKLSRVAILIDSKNSYSTGIADVFAQTFRSLGGAVVADQKYKEGDTDFSSQLVTIRTIRPQAIIVPGLYKDVARIAFQARELGLTIPLIGTDAWETPELALLAGNALANSYFSAHYSSADPNEINQKFVQAYRQRYHKLPDAFAALSYDAVFLLTDAIRRANSSVPAKIRDALSMTKSFRGVTGTLSIDDNRNPVKSGVIFEFRDGKFEYLETLSQRVKQ